VTAVKAFQKSPGLMAAIVLGILTLVEYLVSAGDITGSLLLLTVIAVAKGAIILVSFMHIANVFGATD
jgi:cytochrome c oxidase subunit IV